MAVRFGRLSKEEMGKEPTFIEPPTMGHENLHIVSNSHTSMKKYINLILQRRKLKPRSPQPCQMGHNAVKGDRTPTHACLMLKFQALSQRVHNYDK